MGVMAAARVTKDAITYIAVTSACQQGREMVHALQLDFQMEVSRKEVNNINYNAAISTGSFATLG